MARFEITGGTPVSGTHRVPGNKNAALPMIAAALLTDKPVTLRNLPLIADVRVMLDLARDLGASVELNETDRTVVIQAKKIRTRLSKELCGHVRGSILFAGPLLARFGSAVVYPPGGDVIGRRRIDTHMEGFKAFGASVGAGASFRFKSAGKLKGTRFLLDEASVTGTENLIMAAVLAKGETTLYNTACEPHVQNLCDMLNSMGASISGIGTNRLTIQGVDKLNGTDCAIGSDYIDAVSYMVAALVTGGALTLEGIAPDDFEILTRPLKRFGIRFSIDGTTLRLPGNQKLKTAYDFGEAIPKVEDGIWPAFPSDLMSVLIVLATQTRGTTLFFEKMFESRMYFVDHLIGMGARIVQCDPHRVVVTGATQLQGTRVSSPDIRAGMALLIAALCAKGKTVIHNAESIDRGYEQVDAELRRLGAKITRV